MTVQTTLSGNGLGTSFAGPVIVGPRNGPKSDGTLGANQGIALCAQVVTLASNGSSVVDATLYLPNHTQIVDIIVDTTTAWNSATSDTLSVGTASGGTQYASGVDVKAGAARIRPTFSTTQLANMADTGTTQTVVVSVTPVGSAAAGSTIVTVIYRQTQNYQNN
jgi:hypothetical protein